MADLPPRQKEEPSREDLLKKYADRPPRRLIQFDGFSDGREDYLRPEYKARFKPGIWQEAQVDEYGRCLKAGVAWDLMITPFDVRVLIEPTAPREHVIAHLRNILAQIESGIDVLTIRAEGRAARANAEWDDLPAFDRETLKPEEGD